jgi:hypothetical protein
MKCERYSVKEVKQSRRKKIFPRRKKEKATEREKKHTGFHRHLRNIILNAFYDMAT